MAAPSMKIEYSPEIKEAMKAGTVTKSELYADFCRHIHGDFGDVSPDDVKMNQEAIRTRSGEVWSMYPAVHGERKIYLIQGFRGSEDIGLFCFVGEL